MHENQISGKIIGAAIEAHRILGPGLLESVYEQALCHEFSLRGIEFIRQQNIPIIFKGVRLNSDLRLDLLVEDKVNLKSVIDQVGDPKPYFRFFNLSRTKFKKSLTLLPYYCVLASFGLSIGCNTCMLYDLCELR